MVSSTANLVYELPRELSNELRIRILGNKEILGKSQVSVETWHSAQSLLQKWNFTNSSTKTPKVDIKLDLSSFTEFLYFVSNILSRIVVFFSQRPRFIRQTTRPSNWLFFYKLKIKFIFTGKSEYNSGCTDGEMLY